SRNSPFDMPCSIAPLKPSLVTARSSSSAAAFGSTVGSAAKAAKRLGLAGQVGRDVGAEFLGRRGAVRQHLNVDAGLVHFLEAQAAEVEKPLVGLVAPSRLRPC